MMTRLWIDRSSRGGVLILTDEQALSMLEAGRDIRPIEGVARLIDQIAVELESDPVL